MRACARESVRVGVSMLAAARLHASRAERDGRGGKGSCLGIWRRNLCPCTGIYISIIRIYIRGVCVVRVRCCKDARFFLSQANDFLTRKKGGGGDAFGKNLFVKRFD